MHAIAVAERQGSSAADRLIATGTLPFSNRLMLLPVPSAFQLAPSKPFSFGSRADSTQLVLNSEDSKPAAPPSRGESGKNFVLGGT